MEQSLPGGDDATKALPRVTARAYPTSTYQPSYVSHQQPSGAHQPTSGVYRPGGYQASVPLQATHSPYGAAQTAPIPASAAPIPANTAPIPASEVPDALRGPEAEPEKTGIKVLGISGNQILAGALAASTSAVAASYLGVAGTVVGAGLGSVIATVSSAVYQKSIQRSNRVLAKVTTTVVGKNDDLHDVVADGLSESRSSVVAPDPHLPTSTQVGRGLPDPHRAETPQSPAYPSTAYGSHPPSGADPYAQTVPVRTPDLSATAHGAAQVPLTPPPNRATGKVYGGGSWYSDLPWGRLLAASAAVFILVMGIITAVEAFDQRTLADTLRGTESNRTTTVGSIGKKSEPTPTPSESTSESPSPSDSPSEDADPSDSASPSESPSEEGSPSEESSPSDQAPESPFATDGQAGSPTAEDVVPQPQVETNSAPAPAASLIP